jgi:hypothetical protein
MSSESVCQVARSWVEVGTFFTRLVVRFIILQRQSGIFWIDPCISPHAMKPESSLPCSQKPATRLCPDPNEYSANPSIILSKEKF